MNSPAAYPKSPYAQRGYLRHSGYLRYSLQVAVPWSQDLRNEISRKLPVIKLTAFKCGDGMRLTQSGLIQVRPDTSLFTSVIILDTLMSLEAVTECEFSENRKKSMNKIFFKGFPYQVTKDKVVAFFQQFGPVEYVYFMCGPKRGRHVSKIGYVIFSLRSGVENLLSLKEPLMFKDNEICFEEYKTNIGRVRSRMAKDNKQTSFETQGLETSPTLQTLWFVDKGLKQSQNSISNAAKSPQSFGDRGVAGNLPTAAAKKEECYRVRPWLDLTSHVHGNHANGGNIRFNIDVCQ